VTLGTVLQRSCHAHSRVGDCFDGSAAHTQQTWFRNTSYDGRAVTTEEIRPQKADRRRRRGRKTEQIELVIIDEHPVLRAGVRTLLDNDEGVNVVGEADNVTDAVDMVRESQPDVVLLDVDAADADTVDDMRRLRREVPDGALVVMARHEDDEQVYREVVGGADGHVGESAQPEELVDTIKQAAHGDEPIQRTIAERPAVARRVLETYAELSQRTPQISDSDVSQRELRILELAAEGKTNYQIGREIGLSEHTVKGAISQLLARLALRHRTEAVVHALRLGWITPPKAEPERIRRDDDEI
jgi:DNA-binding NarL/FixJ family response regulator